MIKLYVSQEGNDNWSGQIPFSNQNNSDGPFRTIQRAKEEITKQKENGKLRQPIVFYMKRGTYFLDEPIIFNSDDSGTPKFPVLFTSFKNDKVVISGGKKIEKWNETKINGKEIIVFKVPFIKDDLREIFINGEKRNRTRFPEKKFLLYKRDKIPSDWNKGEDLIYLKEDILGNIKYIENSEFIFLHLWVDVHLPVKEVDYEKGIVKFKKKSLRYLYDGDTPARFYIENIFDIDQKGSFYFDKEKKEIYYIPLENENIFEIVVPYLENLIIFEGNYKNNEFVEYINFKNIIFSHTNFTLDKNSAGDMQAGYEISGSIKGSGCKNITFENCNFSKLGNYAIEFRDGCKNNEIIKCKIFENAGGGIKIGEFLRSDEVDLLKNDYLRHTYGNKIVNCEIYNCGKTFHQCVGVLIGQSYNNIVSNCNIYNLYYSGISVGWTWGYKTSLAYNNIIEYNQIHHIGKPEREKEAFLSDMGGIYTLGIQPGTILRKNKIYNISAYRYGGWGIYLDEGSSEIIVYGNMVFYTTHGGFHQHYGKNNLIIKNIFAFGKETQIVRSKEEQHLSFKFVDNIVYWEEGELLKGNLKDFNFYFDKNIYWNTSRQKFKFGEFTFEQWQEKGMDKNSKIEEVDISLFLKK